MVKPVWNKKYSIGIDQLDLHHQEMFSMTAQAFAAFSAGTIRAEIPSLLERLVDYATYHFHCEEAWMEKIAYPHSAKHKKEHEFFAEKLHLVQVDVEAGRTVTLEVIIFLDKWVREHILHADKEFGKFVNAKLTAAPARQAA